MGEGRRGVWSCRCGALKNGQAGKEGFRFAKTHLVVGGCVLGLAEG
jgi:hypothetical protein